MRRPRVVVSEQRYSVQSRGSQHSAGVLPKSPEPSFGFQPPLHTSSVQGWGVQQRSSVLPGNVSQSLDFTYLVLLQGCVSLHIKGMQQSSRVFPGVSGSSTGLKSLMGRHSLKDPQVLGIVVCHHSILATVLKATLIGQGFHRVRGIQNLIHHTSWHCQRQKAVAPSSEGIGHRILPHRVGGHGEFPAVADDPELGGLQCRTELVCIDDIRELRFSQGFVRTSCQVGRQNVAFA